MTKLEGYMALVKLSAQMVQGINMVPTSWEDHPWSKTTPRAEKHRVLRLADHADDQARRWGIAVKQAADAMMKGSTASGEESNG